MNSKSLKNIVIVFLLLANIFFLWNYFRLLDKTTNISDKMTEDAAILINGKNLIVDMEQIPQKKPSYYIYDGYADKKIFELIAKKLSGSEINKTFPLPGGMSYICGDYQLDFGIADNAYDYFGVSFTDQLYADNFDDSEYQRKKTRDAIIDRDIILNNSDLNQFREILDDFLREERGERFGYAIAAADKEGDSVYLILSQTIDGTVIEGHEVFAEINAKKVRSFVGRWYFGEPSERYTMPLLDSVNILFKAKEKEPSLFDGSERISEILQSFGIIWHANDGFYIIPSWTIKFDSGKKYIYNMVSGDRITQIEPIEAKS